ncbi:DUF4041 domain-containing protein [Moritella sp. Urea-trap-13]|uniref:DUF4041 domain-containing protein n=1 Tax=Moritella sp. Urea-trap-13 TaxID=2058327 RepID=UPI000C330D38|nr:DUF4041 domain-containing protein [Moritella sp. Urea-trap-13]PKH05921.1 hypothetical protein CXF93_08240 [Moritella sp. Urea-trap-13]
MKRLSTCALLYPTSVLSSEETSTTISNVSNESYQFLVLGILTIALIIFYISIRTLISASKAKKEAIDLQKKLDTEPLDAALSRLESEINESKNKVEKNIGLLDTLSKLASPVILNAEKIKVGLLPPTFCSEDTQELKENIHQCRIEQFELIKNGLAVEIYGEFTWLGSKSNGMIFMSSYRDLILRAFNAEYEMICRKMRINSYVGAVEKVNKLTTQLSKLGETANVEVTNAYVKSKLIELKWWYQGLEHIDQLKNQRKVEKQLLREQNKVMGSVNAALEDKIEDSELELEEARKRAEKMVDNELAEIEKMISRIEKEKKSLEEKFERAISQAQITRSGYIYVISNKGSFGEGVVKIGMTRRLEPLDRVRELGNASVPFRFDVHSLTFVDDAPSIEKKLHNKFHDKRVNTENFRKEFFKVSIKEVMEVFDECGLETDWYVEAEAKEYEETKQKRAALIAVSGSKEKPKSVAQDLPEFI